MYIKVWFKPIFPLFLTCLLRKVPNVHGRFCPLPLLLAQFGLWPRSLNNKRFHPLPSRNTHWIEWLRPTVGVNAMKKYIDLCPPPQEIEHPFLSPLTGSHHCTDLCRPQTPWYGIKAKVTPCLVKRYAMKAYGGVEI
jgi:hypothetical protein